MLNAVWEQLREKRQSEERALASVLADGVLHAWDVAWAQNAVEQRDHCIDHQRLREHLPLERVLGGTLQHYGAVLGLRFVRDEQAEQRAWHGDVRAYLVRDAKSDQV